MDLKFDLNLKSHNDDEKLKLAFDTHSSLHDLVDVDVKKPLQDQILQFDQGKWKNRVFNPLITSDKYTIKLGSGYSIINKAANKVTPKGIILYDGGNSLSGVSGTVDDLVIKYPKSISDKCFILTLYRKESNNFINIIPNTGSIIIGSQAIVYKDFNVVIGNSESILIVEEI